MSWLQSRSLISLDRGCSRSPSSERGNQRDRDRERAQARAGGKGGKPGKNDGLTPEQRRERDAKALQEKAAKKAGQDAGGNNAGNDVTSLEEGRDVKMRQNPKKHQNTYQTYLHTTKPRLSWRQQPGYFNDVTVENAYSIQ
ncbi:hypothetical protein CR513_05761, partial [Mucuna pruriens]